MDRGNSAGVAICAQCGARVAGRFCYACGSSRDLEESLFARLKSIVIDPALSALGFLKVTWLLLREPHQFFRRYFKRSAPLADLQFPLGAVWRLLSASPQKVIGPFQYLLAGLALVTIIAAIHSAAWYHAGLGRYAGAGARAFQHSTGIPLKRIDLEHLTGIGLLDEPLHQIVDLVYYGLLAFAVSVGLVGTGITGKELLHYYIYGKGLSLALLSAASVAGLAMFLLLSGYSIEAAVIADSVAEVIGDATSLYILFVLPLFLFPELFPASAARIKLAVAGGAVVWALVNVVLRFALLSRYGWLLSFQ
jgi:hypothetical protein